MRRCIRSIEDPCKVAAIQKFFCVTYNRKTPEELITDECPKEENIPMVQRTANSTDPTNSRINSDNSSPGTSSPKNNFNHVDTGTDCESGRIRDYSIKCKFWYYFFISVTYLGDVIGYSLVIPFIFWNVDAVIARRLVIVWTVIMYMGQAVKEIVCRERPKCPPVIRLQKRWSEEYGMPSTHAMASVVLPASLLYYGRPYEFSLVFGIVVSLVWWVLISFSRLYLGMHSILDVIAGSLLSTLLLIPLLPATNFIDDFLVEYTWSPLILVIASLILIALYPKPRGPMTAHSRIDSAIILATCVGVETGSWLNYKLNITHKLSSEVSHLVVSVPDWKTIGLIVLRTTLGSVCLVVSFVIFELVTKSTYWVLNKTRVSRQNVSDNNSRIPIVDLCLKYLTFCISSMHVVFSYPLLFKLLNIHRPSYLNE